MSHDPDEEPCAHCERWRESGRSHLETPSWYGIFSSFGVQMIVLVALLAAVLCLYQWFCR